MTENQDQEPLPEVIWHARGGDEGTTRVVELWSEKGTEVPVPIIIEARSDE